MRRIIHFLRGNIRAEVMCPYPERLMNLCAHNQIAFWDLVRLDAVTVEISMSLSGFRRLEPLLENIGATAKRKRKRGAPVLFWRVRKRYALLAGLLLALIATWVLSLFIWEIEIVGNQEVPAVEILRVLETQGVGIGAFGPNIEPEALRNRILLEMEDISWITINVHGSHATVIVRERQWPPEMHEETAKTVVYATQSGIVEQMFVWAGTVLVEIGDTVEIGQDLVTGRMESILGELWFVRADAQIYARTWYEMSMSMPLFYLEKEYTGESSAKSTMFWGNQRINLFFDSGISYANYDKIVSRRNFSFPGGIILPIAIERRVYEEYRLVRRERSSAQAAMVLQERLLDELAQMLGASGQIIRSDFEVELHDGMITVHLQAEAREQIAALRRITEEERLAPIVPDNMQEAVW